ncbi:MAG TPA: amino acid adenylation domain-containing protein, partial [Chitinophaga sp.]|uniref:non-ribosomal peptide synthetase n=1 Tax=Chitinophaga sp. TaxID=1869181 RepID=UPI002C19AB83
EEIRAILSTQHLHNGNAQTPSAITAADRGDMSLIPLSYSQERLWFLDQLESSANYHIPAILRLKGSLHHEALAYALRTIVNRHEVLRTIIEEEDGKAHQRVLEKDLWELDIITHGHEEEAVALQSFVKSLIDIPFDLGNDHMLRAHLTRKDEEEHLLVVVMHHIASDGWSVGIIVKELIALYEAYGEGRTADLSTMDIQYADYAIWQRRHISGAVIDKQLDYWKHKLNDVQPLQLPTDYPRPAIQSTRGAQVLFHFDKQLAAKLNRLSRSHDVTLYMTLLAAFNVLLHRYTGQDDICVGSPVAGRTMQEVEDLVGFFINTLALRNNLAGNPSFTAVLQQVRQTMLGAYDHQDVPFEKIVEAVTKERDMSRSPLFQVVFVLQNTPDAPELQLGGLQLTHEQALHTTAKFDLSFVIHEDETGLSGKVEYCAELFKEDTVTRMVAHFQQLLQSLAANPGENIGSLAMLSGEEQQLLTTGFNNRVANYPADKTAVALFEEKAAAIPDAPALLFADGQLTYSQLDEYANRIAQLLQQNGVLPETLVPLCIERSPLTIAAILGILKAGGAYVPIDPDYPAERISYVLEDTQASLVLSSKASMGKIPAKDGLRVIALDDDTAATDSYAAVKPEVTLNAGNLAYIIYTSGSTGKPKGVMIAHRGLVNLALGQAELLRLKEGMRYLQFASFGFDASCYEIFNTLLSGGALVLPSKEELLTAERFGEMVSRYNVEVVTLPPSYQHMIKEVLGPVKTVVSAGEPLIREDARYMQSAGIRLINAYGPTENTVCTTLTDNPLRDNGVVSIGDPVPNVQVYILDAYKGLSPMGVAGEICVGGANLARGYLHREALTNEKFISNPFSNDAESRLYRTGDLGRWLPDGTIEYLGRIDDQVKIRGYRIEPGEIESVLQQCTLVDEAVVIAKADQQQHHHKRLIGYVVPVGPFDREGITAWLRQQLPEYMVPAMIIPLDKLPVTPSGKVDRKALPEPDVQALTKAAYNAPRNAAEQAIAAIWQELLGLQRVGIHDNFFELGGDSIITIQVVSRAKQQGYVLHPRDLFTHQTISELSPLLTTAKTAAIFGEQGMLTGVSGLLPIQQWFFETGGSGNAHFNQSVLLSIGKSVEASVLDAAIKQLVRYHDALRFTYRPDSKGFIQEYGDYEPRLETVDLRNIPAEDLTARIEAYASDCHQGPDTGKGTLFHAALLQMPSDETHNRLLFIIHHLAVDGVSWRILLQDLETLLKKKGNRKAAAVLGLKGSSFRQWYDALASYGHRPQLLHQQEYWEKTVQRYVPLKTDKKSDSIVTAADTAHIVVKLPAAQTQRLLQEAPRAYHTEINDLLLAALAKTIAGWTQTADVLIGLEGHGREDISAGIDISRTVGWFTNLYPVLLEVKPGKDNGSFLKDIKEQLRKIKDKGVGYGVLKYINRTSALQGKDPWDVIFNYLGQTDNVIREDGILTSAPESSGSGLGAAFPVREKLSVNSIIQDEELVLQWGYSTLHYEAESISTLAAAFVSNLELLIAHCTEQAANGTVYTPADYNLGDEVSNEELDAFLDTPFAGAPRRAQVESLYRLSSLQEGMLFHNLINEQAAVYVEPMSCQLRNLDEDIFLQSWNELTRRHSILRTAFYHQVFSIPVQCVYNQVRIPFNVIDLRHLDETARGQAIQEYEAADGKTAFDLAAAPLMRITLFRLQGNDYRMLWTSHHIILDGWSLAVMVKELLEIYESLATGGPLSFVTVDQFEDYIRYLERRDKEQDEYYWRNYLHTLTAGNLLPFISSTAERTRGTGIYREKLLRINAAATGRLAQYAQRSHITLNTLMQGVWSYLLYRYTGSNEVVYGITVSGRPDDLSGIEQRVGLYINTIPSHTVLEPEAGITEWLRQLQNGQMQSREYQYVGLNEIQRWTGLQGELFDTSITFQNYPINEVVASHSWKLQIDDVEAHPHTNYPLTIIIGIAEEASLLFTYNSDLLPTFYIEQIAAHFEETLEQMITHEDGKIADIDLLTPAGLSELAGRGAHRIAVTVPEKPFTHLFESQVRHTPQAVALAFEDHILTYQELDERSSQLANYLRSKGVGADTLVPLCIERSAAMIIAILGIVKAGGAYVPIEPDFPAERIKFMLEDTRASVIVSSNTAREALPDISGLDIIAIEDGKIDSCSTIVRELPFTADRLLYVIYTSGSTGTPKGVLVTHGNLYDYIAGLSAALPVNACRSFGLLSSIATDLGNTVLFSALLSGAVLHLFSKAAINDAGYMYDYMDKYPVDCIKIVPSHWKALSEPEKLLLPAKLLIFGGEALESAVVESIWMSGSRCTVVNHYGPTETTIGKLLHVVNTDSLYDDVVPVGK